MLTRRPTSLGIAAALLIGAGCAATARAQVSDREPLWILKGGPGLSYHLHERNSDERLLLFAPEVAKPLGRHWEYVIEGNLSRFTSPPGYFVGVLPVGARYLPLTGPIRPFVSVEAGLGWTDLANIPEISRRFNFLLQGDLGVRWRARGEQTWHVSGRLLHISNAGTTKSNLGLNCIVLLFGGRIR
jgi:lipid A 3-O-deacylase PagL